MTDTVLSKFSTQALPELMVSDRFDIDFPKITSQQVGRLKLICTKAEICNPTTGISGTLYFVETVEKWAIEGISEIVGKIVEMKIRIFAPEGELRDEFSINARIGEVSTVLDNSKFGFLEWAVKFESV